MKPNPPETAPKNDFILGVLNQEKRIIVWNHNEGTWQFVVRTNYPYRTVATYLEMPMLKYDKPGCQHQRTISCLEDGWFDGRGMAPDADALKRIHEKLRSISGSVPPPQIIPKPDGNLLLEWQAEGYPSLDIDLATLLANFHAFGVNDEDIERDFHIDDNDGWYFLSEHIRRNK